MVRRRAPHQPLRRLLAACLLAGQWASVFGGIITFYLGYSCPADPATMPVVGSYRFSMLAAHGRALHDERSFPLFGGWGSLCAGSVGISWRYCGCVYQQAFLFLTTRVHYFLFSE
ncbi:MAG: hypothetical protein EOO65_02900 [Methanosarcinales archaeon]|nr:MAG: hypothetical protein EOO65_02900 [Methanosarcinales archaeon]